MKLTEKQKASHREAFKKMNFQDKMIYIFSYYKAYILVPLIALILLGHFLYTSANKKEEVLYLAFINVATGQDIETAVNEDFLSLHFEKPQKKKVVIYKELYLSDNASVDNNRYAYASRIKILGSIEAKKLDICIVNKEAYDLLSNSGYLYDLNVLLSKEELSALNTHLTYNDVLINDNRIDHLLNEETSIDSSAVSVCNGIDISDFKIIRDAGFSDTIYLCVIANSERIETVRTFISYLSS